MHRMQILRTIFSHWFLIFSDDHVMFNLLPDRIAGQCNNARIVINQLALDNCLFVWRVVGYFCKHVFIFWHFHDIYVGFVQITGLYLMIAQLKKRMASCRAVWLMLLVALLAGLFEFASSCAKLSGKRVSFENLFDSFDDWTSTVSLNAMWCYAFLG